MARLTVIDRGDVDIDFADRSIALDGLYYVPASIVKDKKIIKHNTGVYFHSAPIDPMTNLCSIDYEQAEQQGMFKIDMLNVSVYSLVRNEEHLVELMNRPLDWDVFSLKEFVQELFHLGNHSDLTARLKPKSIEHLAIILALIRPGKKHLQRKCASLGFDSIANEIWMQGSPDEYVFKKSHAIGYAMLVYVHANILLERMQNDVTLFSI